MKFFGKFILGTLVGVGATMLVRKLLKEHDAEQALHSELSPDETDACTTSDCYCRECSPDPKAVPAEAPPAAPVQPAEIIKDGGHAE